MKLRTVACLLASIFPVAAQTAATADWEVSGAVKGPAGPLKGVWVSIVGPAAAKGARTDSSGRFTLKGTLPGTYSLRVGHSKGFTQPHSRTLTLAAGEKVEHLDILCPQGGVITGKVENGAGQPMAGIIVSAYLKSHERGRLKFGLRQDALTDDQGRYRVTHLPDGEYLVAAVTTAREPLPVRKRASEPPEALAPAYPPLTFSPAGRTPEAAASIEIRDGGERSGVDITLKKEPQSCIFFRATATSDMEAGTTTTASVRSWLSTLGPLVASGKVVPGEDSQLCGLPEGDYQLGVLSYQKPQKGVGYGQLRVALGKRHLELGDIPIQAPRDLSGRVTVRGAKDGELLREGIVVAPQLQERSLLFGDFPSGRVQPDGTFTVRAGYVGVYGFQLTDLPTGHYVLRADQDGQDARSAGIRQEGGPLQIELAADGPTLSGKVTDESHQAVPEATVFLIPAAGDEVRAAQTDQAGAYRFTSGLPPGEYKLVAVAGLAESQRWDGLESRRYLDRAVSLKLAARQQAVRDLPAGAR
jgi:hypothetical protein